MALRGLLAGFSKRRQRTISLEKLHQVEGYIPTQIGKQTGKAVPPLSGQAHCERSLR